MSQDTYLQERNHYDNLKAELGYDTVFDLDIGGCKPLDFKIFLLVFPAHNNCPRYGNRHRHLHSKRHALE